MFQEDEGFAIVRAGTVEFQAGEFGLEVEGVVLGQGGKAEEDGALGGAEQGEAGEVGQEGFHSQSAPSPKEKITADAWINSHSPRA